MENDFINRGRERGLELSHMGALPHCIRVLTGQGKAKVPPSYFLAEVISGFTRI